MVLVSLFRLNYTAEAEFLFVFVLLGCTIFTVGYLFHRGFRF